MAYWVYENWRAEHKAIIHRGECGNCKHGHGCHPSSLGNSNGRWLGPFDTLAKATAQATTTGRPVRPHRCV
jgi:hypothetical protein